MTQYVRPVKARVRWLSHLWGQTTNRGFSGSGPYWSKL